MTNDARADLVLAVVNLRHLYAEPTIDRDALAPEIHRIDGAIHDIDVEDAELRASVAAAKAMRVLVDQKLIRAEQALRRVAQALGPAVPNCPGCATEIGIALDAVRDYGIIYRPRQQAAAPDEQDPAVNE